MILPITHSGVEITRPEVPGALYTWTHDETDGHGAAPDIEAAKRQIDRHLANCGVGHG